MSPTRTNHSHYDKTDICPDSHGRKRNAGRGMPGRSADRQQRRRTLRPVLHRCHAAKAKRQQRRGLRPAEALCAHQARSTRGLLLPGAVLHEPEAKRQGHRVLQESRRPGTRQHNLPRDAGKGLRNQRQRLAGNRHTRENRREGNGQDRHSGDARATVPEEGRLRQHHQDARQARDP